jgi:hypothetical protein
MLHRNQQDAEIPQTLTLRSWALVFIALAACAVATNAGCSRSQKGPEASRGPQSAKQSAAAAKGCEAYEKFLRGEGKIKEAEEYARACGSMVQSASGPQSCPGALGIPQSDYDFYVENMKATAERWAHPTGADRSMYAASSKCMSELAGGPRCTAEESAANDRCLALVSNFDEFVVSERHADLARFQAIKKSIEAKINSGSLLATSCYGEIVNLKARTPGSLDVLSACRQGPPPASTFGH